VYGLSGAISGARIAASTMIKMMTAPTPAARLR
jgi:hypothetical protein